MNDIIWFKFWKYHLSQHEENWLRRSRWHQEDLSLSHCLPAAGPTWWRLPGSDLHPGEALQTRRGRAACHSLMSGEFLHTKDTLVGTDRWTLKWVLFSPGPGSPTPSVRLPAYSLLSRLLFLRVFRKWPTPSWHSDREQVHLLPPSQRSPAETGESLLWRPPPQGDHESSLMEDLQRTWKLPWWTLTDETHIAPGSRTLQDLVGLTSLGCQRQLISWYLKIKQKTCW
jgi:hypothetical protein